MSRPVVAIVSNALTPYRLHYHRRLVRELPDVEWWSLFTHDLSNAPWSQDAEAEIRPVKFGPGEPSDTQSHLRNAVHEFRKGGRVIRWLTDHRTAAVILLGYNDPGRLRILNWCRRSGVPCFLFGDSNVRGDRSTGVRAVFKRLILPRILRRCTGVLPCGSLGRAYFRRYGVPDQKMFDTPYEPDYAMIASISPSEVEAAYAALDLSPGDDYLLYCGRLTGVKRVDLVISAFAAVADDRPGWRLLLIGDGALRGELQDRVPTQIRARVHWAGFLDDQRAVACLQRGAKVLIIPSDYEPWGVVVNEAAAAGLAVVASDAVGAAAELVRDRVNGRLFPTGDSEALVEAIRDVTEPASLGQYRAASAGVLADWRRRGDPVAGLAAALSSAGVTHPARLGLAPDGASAPNTDTGRQK